MKNRRNFYRVLQVQPDAPVAVIRASYKTLMLELKQHPDLGGDLWNAQVLNEAYALLSNSEKRREYDRKLFEQYTKKPFPDPFSGQSPLISIFCPFCKRPMARQPNPDDSCPSCRSPLQTFVQDPLQASRRVIPRIKRSGKFRYYTTWPQKGRQAELVDLSREGMRFKCEEKLRVGMLVKISSSYLKGVAKIKNVHKIYFQNRTVYSVGAEFVSVTFKEPKGGFYSATA